MEPIAAAEKSATSPRKTRVSRAASVALSTRCEPSEKRMRGAIPQPLEAASLPDALLKIKTVSTVTGLSDSSIYRKLAAKQFPEPVRLGARCTRFRAADVRAWMAAQGSQAKSD